MKRLLVIGAGGHAKVVIDSARCSGEWELVGILDDKESMWGKSIEGVQVVGPTGNWDEWKAKADAAIVAVGSNSLRQEIRAQLSSVGIPLATIVHPRSVLATSAKLGSGTVLMAGAVVNSDAKIGQGVIINTGATVDHDCDIGDWTHLGPGSSLCGDVSVGCGCLLGVGVKVIPGVKIGDQCIVGAGSVVSRNIESGVKVVGIPARLITER